jgi:hypothetical protein
MRHRPVQSKLSEPDERLESCHSQKMALHKVLLILLTIATSLSNRAMAAKHYVLPATPDNVQWGWYDVNERPRLTIHSGDTVSIETLSHSLGQIKPGVEID